MWRLTVDSIELTYFSLVGLLTAMSMFDVKVAIALIVGTWLQFWFAVNKSFKLFVMIVVSTAFVAFTVLSPILDIMKVPHDSPIRVLVYSLSALISVEIINLIITLLPKAVKKRIKEKLNLVGVENDK